jgi:hypothetical protein
MLSVVVFKWDPLPNQREFLASQIGKTKISYGKSHINKHFNMVKRHLQIPFQYIVICDKPLEDLHPYIQQKPLWSHHRLLGSCFTRLFTFSRDFSSYVGNRFVAMDLDMVITGDITDLLSRDEPFVYYKMRGPDGTPASGWRMNNGIYMMDTGSRHFVWEIFNNDPEDALRKRARPGSDQGWTNHIMDLANEAHWLQQRDGIYDMRQNFLEKGRTEIPQNCKIVMWPGPRDPSESAYREDYAELLSHYK